VNVSGLTAITGTSASYFSIPNGSDNCTGHVLLATGSFANTCLRRRDAGDCRHCTGRHGQSRRLRVISREHESMPIGRRERVRAQFMHI
jgi:hypothetical protein